LQVPEIAEPSCTKQLKGKKPTRTKNGAKNKKTAEDSTNSKKSTKKLSKPCHRIKHFFDQYLFLVSVSSQDLDF
jgi:hypothetical protein